MANLLTNLTLGFYNPKPANAQDPNYSIGAQPTPLPVSGANYNANQSAGGSIIPNSGIAPNSSYGGSSYNSQGQIISTAQNPSIKTPSTGLLSGGSVLGTNNAPTGGQSNNGLNGFDMKYYPGWSENEARADWVATGGSKGRQSVPGSGNTNFLLKPTGDLLSQITPVGGDNTTPSNDMEGYFKSLKDAAQAGDQAAIDQLNQVYGQQTETLNKQYGQAETDQGLAEKELALQLQNAETETTGQKTKAEESVMSESEKAAEAARSAQRQNRNIMRALGVLGSTYASEALQNPMNELAKQKASFAKWGMDQIATLDQNLTKFKGELALQKDKILSQYASIKSKIQDDIRYTDQQKATSLAALKAGAQQNLAKIEGDRISYQQQLDQQKIGFTTQIAQILLNKNPNADLGAIMKQAMQTTGQVYSPTQQVATVAATPNKKYLSGLA